LTRVVLLSGGVGGARAARGLAAILGRDLTVVANVGDDDEIYGLHVSADLDTIAYTLAGIEGPQGWGVHGDTFRAMDGLAGLGIDTTFRIGDADLAVNLHRTAALRDGVPLHAVTRNIAAALGVPCRLLPATDDRVRTEVRTVAGEWLSFQDYFVLRGHRDDVAEVRYAGAPAATPAPGVLEAVGAAAFVVIAPSNPPLSIWPILAVPGIRGAVAAVPRVVAVSPLFGGKALKGPADRVMAALGLPTGNLGVAAAYEGLLTDLVVDTGDSGDEVDGVTVHATDTRVADPEASRRFAATLLGIMGAS
jgi:LPPG:FO 2-phospho-L-lactate transferase